MPFKVYVKVAGEDCDTHGWHSNGIGYATMEAASEAAESLFSRWMAVKEYKVIEVPEGTPAYAVWLPETNVVTDGDVVY